MKTPSKKVNKKTIRVGLHDTFGKSSSNNALNNTIQRKKVELFGKKLNIGKVQEFCEKITSIPEDEHEAYVLANEHSENIKESPEFKCMLSTKFLLRKAAILTENMSYDSTYKMNLQGIPVIVIGSVDKANQFHLLEFGFISHQKQNTEDYEFCFEGLKKRAKEVNGIEYGPKILLSDGDICIHNAFRRVFG